MKFYFLFILLLYYNCFMQLRPPPITFTQTQTAAERQMIGEDKELEKDGWLLSSIKTSSSGMEEWKAEIREEFGDPAKNSEYLSLQRTNAYTSAEIKRLKEFGVLGEGLDGKVYFLSQNKSRAFEKEYPTPESKKRLEDLLKLVNETREKLRNRKLEKEKPHMKPEDWKALENNLKLEYYNSVEEMEYLEASKGKWKQKD